MAVSGLSGKLILQHSNLASQYCGGFKQLKEAGELLDVTLVTDEDSYEVHKVVLSANSPLFRKILNKQPNAQAQSFIFLRGVKSEFLKIIIDFVYNGEAFIESKDLNGFLEVAHDLQISGLAEEDVEPTDKASDKDDLDGNAAVHFESAKELLKLASSTKKVKENEKSNGQFKFEKIEPSKEPKNLVTSIELNDKEDTAAEENDGSFELHLNIDEETLKELRAEIYNNVLAKDNSEGGKTFFCKICDKDFKRRDKANIHVESHLERFSFGCEFCDKTMKTRTALRNHVKHNHTKKTRSDISS